MSESSDSVEETFNYHVGVIAAKTDLSTNTIKDLLRSGWTYTQKDGAPDRWDKLLSLKFTVSKEELFTNRPDMISVITEEMREMVGQSLKTKDDIPDCPDCVQGKHGNCSGTSWNNTLDRLDMCPCEVRDHDCRS